MGLPRFAKRPAWDMAPSKGASSFSTMWIGICASSAANFSFSQNARKNAAVLHFLANLDGNPASNPNSAASKNLQRQVSRFGAIHGNPEVERLDAYRALPRKSQARDLGRGVRLPGSSKDAMPHGGV